MWCDRVLVCRLKAFDIQRSLHARIWKCTLRHCCILCLPLCIPVSVFCLFVFTNSLSRWLLHALVNLYFAIHLEKCNALPTPIVWDTWPWRSTDCYYLCVITARWRPRKLQVNPPLHGRWKGHVATNSPSLVHSPQVGVTCRTHVFAWLLARQSGVTCTMVPHLQRGSRVFETGTRRPRKENRKKSRRIPAKTSNKKMIIPVMRLIQATGAARGRVSFPA